jgi:predicted ABC-type ATPase
MGILKRVTIMRGLPGSGKSTWIQNNLRGQRIHSCVYTCSADLHFMQGGKYVFNPLQLGEAHRGCLRAFVDLVVMPWDPALPTCEIVVDNTNMRVDEMLPYIRVAQAYGIPIQVVNLIISTETAVERNLHGVPNHSIKRMAERYQPTPSYLKEVGLFEEFFHFNDSVPVYSSFKGVTCERMPADAR